MRGAMVASTAAAAIATSLAVGTILAAQGAMPQACALLSSAEVAKLTGRSELSNARQIPSREEESQIGADVVEPGATGCGYLGSSLNVEVQRLKSIEAFEAAASRRVKAGEFQPYAGLGDAAWARYNKYLAQHGFVVRVGRYALMIMMDTKEAGSEDTAKAQLLPLVKAAISRLQ